MLLNTDTVFLILIQLVLALAPLFYMLNGEVANTNLKVFGSNRPVFELMVYHTASMLTITSLMH